jgi:beta-galactosidase
LQVDVYSRCEKVTLELNGDKVGTKETNRSNKFTASFKVPYKAGTLKAAAYNGDKLVDTFTIQTAGDPVKLKLTADRTNIKADGQDLSFIVVELVDERGLRSPFARELVEFSIKGPGEIIAIGSSDPKSVESFQQKKRTTFQGRCIAIVKSTKDKGDIIVTAKSEGLPDRQIIILSTKIICSAVR